MEAGYELAEFPKDSNHRENLCLQNLIGRPVILALFYWAEKAISRYLVCFIKPKFKILKLVLVSSLLLRVVLFVPLEAEADYNSQNMPLLTPNVAMVPEQNSTASGVNIVSDNAMQPTVGALGVSSGTDTLLDSPLETSIYVVRKGDSISQVADMYGVSVNTILWANDMKKGDPLKEGDVLVILPVSGVEHVVAKGQTLQSIAKIYNADAGDIALFNGIAPDASLNVGDKLLIPDGEMMDEGGDKPAANLKASESKDIKYYAASFLKNIIGYFIDPVPTGHKTQGLHGPGMRGIDIGAPTGTNIYASAPGVVIATKTGCTVGYSRCGGGYGNMVQIQHPNGTKTLYGHMSKVLVAMGTKVDRGDVIGLVGSTGHSTGPHVHFEVFNAKNPGANWSWAK